MKKLILYTLILLLMSCRSTQEVDTSVYMDAKQPVDKRVELQYLIFEKTNKDENEKKS